MTKTIRISGGRSLPVLLVALMALSVLASGIGAANPSSEVALDGDKSAPNPYFDVDEMTVSAHPMGQGASHSDMAGYYDDSGDWVSDTEFEVNTTSDEETGENVNPYSFVASHVDADFYSEFPRTGTDDDGNQEASAIDSDEWSTDASSSTGSIDVTDSEVASDVDSVRVSTSGQSADDTAVASYSNWTSELDADEEKRAAQFAFDVDSIDSGATVDVNITDEDGDKKTLTIDPSGDTEGDASVMANSTGSHVYQVKLSALDTVDDGDGSYSNIESIDVAVNDGNADVAFSWIDLEKKGKMSLAETTVADDDGEFTDTEDVYNATGEVNTHSMETLAGAYDDATIVDVSFPITASAAHLDGEEGQDGDYFIEAQEEENYPAYDHNLNTSYRMSLPNAIDVTYSGVDLKFEQDFISDRYQTVGYEQGASDSTNLSQADLLDRAGSLDSVDDKIVLDSAVAPGEDYIVTFELLLTSDELSDMQDAAGGAAAPPSAGSGGIIGFITSVPGMLLSAATGFLSFGWLRSRIGSSG